MTFRAHVDMQYQMQYREEKQNEKHINTSVKVSTSKSAWNNLKESSQYSRLSLPFKMTKVFLRVHALDPFKILILLKYPEILGRPTISFFPQ